jgi:hypothetical protein
LKTYENIVHEVAHEDELQDAIDEVNKSEEVAS